MKSVSLRCVGAGLLSVMALSPSFAKADIGTIVDSNSAYTGSLGLGFLNYKEKVDPPDSEHGWMPAVGLGVSYMSPTSHMWYSLDGRMIIGDEDYNGADMYTGTPIQATTHTMILETDAKIGKGFALSKSVMLTPYFDLGFRYWSRDLDSYVEKYQNMETLVGVMFQYSPSKRVVLTTYGAAGAQFMGQMSGLAREFDLGPSPIFKAGAKVGVNVSKRWEVFTALDFDYFRYGKSDVVTGFYEPSSFTTDTVLRVGVAYHMR